MGQDIGEIVKNKVEELILLIEQTPMGQERNVNLSMAIKHLKDASQWAQK